MTSLFISYSRKDIETARKLTEAFHGQGLDFWIDWEGIPPTVDWWKEIEKGIEEADIFLFLLSPDSAASTVCRREIEHAVKNGKRLVPLVVRDIKGEESPIELSHLNWIFLRDQDDFDTAFGKLIIAIKTDYEWVQAHSQLQVKAREWERNNHENGFLLHGKELQDAEFQLVANSAKQPHPTDLQREYVLKSRQVTDRQRRTITSVSVAGLIVVAALAVYGFLQAGLATERGNAAQTAQANAEIEADQRATAQAIAEENQNLAEERARIARAGELAAQSASLRETNLSVSLLLGIEAFGKLDSIQTRSALLDNLQASPQLTGFLRGHLGPVSSVAYSPDGKMLASVGEIDNTIILWDVQSHQPIGQLLEVDAIAMGTVVFSPDGKSLASGSWDKEGNGVINLWEVDSRQPIGQPMIAENSFEVLCLAFSPNGKLLAAGYQDSSILLWDVVSQQPIGQFGQSLQTNSAPVHSVAFSPDGKTLAAGDLDGKVILWDVESYQPTGRLFNVSPGFIISLTFSLDGKTLVSGSDFASVTHWDIESQQLLDSLRTNSIYASAMAFSPDRKTLASGSNEDGYITLWDLESHEPIGQSLNGHSSFVKSVMFSPDGKTLASGGEDGIVILWSVTALQPIAHSLDVEPLSYEINVAFSPDGRTLASGSSRGTVILWDMESRGLMKQLLHAHANDVNGVTFSPDGKILASWEDDGTIILWDLETQQTIGQPLRPPSDSGGDVVAFSPDAKTIVSEGTDGEIILWDVDQQRMGQSLHPSLDAGGNLVAISPNGRILALEESDGDIILWDLDSRQPIGQPMGGHPVYVGCVAFSLNGRILAVEGRAEDDEIILWDVESQQRIGQLRSPFGLNCDSVAFSPDGQMLAWGAFGTIVLWDLETRQPIGQPLGGHLGSVSSLVFSPDGKALVSGAGGSTIFLWDLDLESWIDKTCQRVGRNFTRAEWSQYFPDEDYRFTCPQWPAGE